MFQTKEVLVAVNMVLFLTFGHLKFEFVSNFDIRISNFVMSLGKIMPSGPGYCAQLTAGL